MNNKIWQIFVSSLFNMDLSSESLIIRLNNLFQSETFNYTFYDFERVEIKEKNKLYLTLEKIKNNSTFLKLFCTEINHELLDYEIVNITNIICGKTYKYKNRTDLPIQIPNGFYYSFTVLCKKKNYK
jgi:hypothetical protein